VFCEKYSEQIEVYDIDSTTLTAYSAALLFTDTMLQHVPVSG